MSFYGLKIVIILMRRDKYTHSTELIRLSQEMFSKCGFGHIAIYRNWKG